MSSNFSAALHYHAEARFLLDFVRLNVFERLPEFCYCLDVGSGVYCLSSQYRSTRITPSQSQKTLIVTLRGLFEFLGGESEDGTVLWSAFFVSSSKQ
jgi:hypothetical protein